MSGICAVWRKQNPAQVPVTLTAIGRGLSHTHGERFEHKNASEAGVAVSAIFATQQIYDDGRLLVACDADLYNEPEVRSRTGGHAGTTAALIAAAYDRFGSAFPEKLQGNFSVVVWDRRERKLTAAVDRFGVNRLVYFDNGSMLLIGSRIDALMRSGEIPADVNPQAIANFMNWGVNLAPDTIIRGVRRLPPACTLVAGNSGVRVAPYWNMRYGLEGERGEEKLSRQLEQVVEEAVARQCKDESLSETGAFLSGGTDSSTVVGMMARMGRGPVKAFSIGFHDERFNELSYAELAARKFQAQHYTYQVSADDCFQALPNMVRLFDEPFGNSSAIPTYFCARLAADNGVKTLLAGDGGDELFGGNERYLVDKIFNFYHTIPGPLRKLAIEPLAKLLPNSGPLAMAKSYVRRSNLPGFERFYSYNFLYAHGPENVFEESFVRELSGHSLLDIPAAYYNECQAKDHLDRLLYLDVKITLGDSDLPKVTQMAELAGVQTRYPFLDSAVAEFSGRIPANLKVKGTQKRYLFKRAFRDLLPQEILKKKKHGFGIPVSTWLKTDPRLRELCHDTLFSAQALQRGYFRRDFLEDLVRKHEADDSTYYGDTVWTFLVLELWHRQFVDQPVGAAAV
jgi:asparagine synthase (glutamine-hydrolysing)